MKIETSTLIAQWNEHLQAELDRANVLRQTIHQSPCLSGQEQATTDLVTEAMELTFETVAGTGAIAALGPSDGPAIAVRAELDALPVLEETPVSWKSMNGAMHACGHDVHLAALTAMVRAAKKIALPYTLVPFLQPREETYPSGALDIKESGVFHNYRVQRAIGAHVHPAVPLGSVSSGGGFVNAAAGELSIFVQGQGGHGAYPHKANDVAVCTAQIATAIAEIVRRTVDPMLPALVSIGSINVGSGAANVLPGQGTILATVRGPNRETNEAIVSAVEDFSRATAKAFGCTATVDYSPGEPALINDDNLADHFVHTAKAIGLSTFEPMRSLGADDFSYYGDLVPSLMCFVGTQTGSIPSLHDATFLPPEEAVLRTAQCFIAGYAAAAEALQ